MDKGTKLFSLCSLGRNFWDKGGCDRSNGRKNDKDDGDEWIGITWEIGGKLGRQRQAINPQ